jgi:aerobic-type carbon monoxide dehydrogenase small subunit (CoxS/CutS family)
MQIQLTINEKPYTIELTGHETLLEVLRDKLSLTGTKTSCQESECGACTVIMEGKAILACITLAANLDGATLRTIEGLAKGDVLHPVQKAFIEHGSVQCGFCIPGMIMSSTALLEKNPNPTQTEIEYALDGNICRCAGYHKIFDAIKAAGKEMQKGS